MAEHCELGAEHTHTVAEEAVLQDDAIPVVFDPASGVLTRMEQRPSKWIVELAVLQWFDLGLSAEGVAGSFRRYKMARNYGRKI